jgi:hypothetical protein
MAYDFLLKDLQSNLTQKAIGTDKGLAKIGDGVVNLIYSVAKSIFLTKTSHSKLAMRTGKKVSKTILAEALKEANMKGFSRSRADAHDLADTVESVIAYVWLNGDITIKQLIDFLTEGLKGNLNNRTEETYSARFAFIKLLNHIKQYLPTS